MEQPHALVALCPGSSLMTSTWSANALGGAVMASTPSEHRCRRPGTRMSTDNVWLSTAQESTCAFETFSCYRDMGPARSTAEVARALGRSKTLMDRWSARYA